MPVPPMPRARRRRNVTPIPGSRRRAVSPWWPGPRSCRPPSGPASRAPRRGARGPVGSPPVSNASAIFVTSSANTVTVSSLRAASMAAIGMGHRPWTSSRCRSEKYSRRADCSRRRQPSSSGRSRNKPIVAGWMRTDRVECPPCRRRSSGPCNPADGVLRAISVSPNFQNRSCGFIARCRPKARRTVIPKTRCVIAADRPCDFDRG